jgi:hypothetical protein
MRLATSIMVPVWCLITVLMTAPLWAAEESASELAKKTQNPVADLISVPLQNNFNLSAGPNDARLGTSQWSMGPAAVVLSMQGPWVFGALANQQWSFAGWGDQDVSAMLIQPFVNYNLPDAWYLVSAPIITANWEASSNNTWTVPVGGVWGSCSSWTSCRSIPSWRPSTTASGPSWRRTGSCVSSCSFSSPSRRAEIHHQPI